MTDPKQGEEVFMYVAIAVACFVVYLIYCQVTKPKYLSDSDIDQLTMADVVTKDSAMDPEDKLLQSLDQDLAKF